MRKKIAIVGHGYVGKAMSKFFESHYDLVIYDPPAGYDCLLYTSPSPRDCT